MERKDDGHKESNHDARALPTPILALTAAT